MKVLIIDEWIPWPLESGKKIRSYNLTARLAKKHQITYMAYANIPEETSKVRALQSQGVKVETVEDVRTPKWTMKFYFRVLLNLLSREPFSSQYHIRKPFKVELEKLIEREKPDIIHCEWTNLAPFLAHCRTIPKVIVAHNIESEIWKRWAQNEKNLLKRLIAGNQAKKIERLEKKWYPMADHCIAVTDEDRRVIESYRAKASLVENGVDVAYYDDYSGGKGDGKVLIFTASFDTFANQDGARFLVKDIMPLIKRDCPKIKLWLVGKGPTSEIINYGKTDNSIVVTGTVPDVREYIGKAGICVVPLRIGGGSRLKILEALAMRKPVVSTSLGAEGLTVTHGRDILLADQPEQFVASVLECIRNREIRKSLGDSGYMLVRERYDWDYLAKKQDLVWKKTALEADF